MFRHGRQLTYRAVLGAVLLTLLPATLAGAALSPHISQSSIAGIKLGMTKAQVKATLGRASTRSGTFDNPGAPEGWKALVFAKPKVAVYFEKGRHGAIMVTTWNRRIQTAQGVGPCTPISKLKTVYGSALQPSQHNIDQQGNVYAYTLGKGLMFGADGPPPNPSTSVTAVGLYNGKAAMQGYAGFVTVSERNCG